MANSESRLVVAIWGGLQRGGEWDCLMGTVSFGGEGNATECDSGDACATVWMREKPLEWLKWWILCELYLKKHQIFIIK